MTLDDTVIRVTGAAFGDAMVLTATGLLSSATYRPLRDAIIAQALEEPAAVIVDVTRLRVPSESAWTVFTSARWHVARWPDVPVLLVCAHGSGRSVITRNGIVRHVPVFSNATEAIVHLHNDIRRRFRRRGRLGLEAHPSSLARSRAAVESWLQTWSQPEYIPVAKVVATALVDNVLRHTRSQPRLRLESESDVVTVAVEDGSRHLAHVREDLEAPDPVSGLKIVGALARGWGNAPTPNGKAVWAVLGPENRL